MASWGEMAQSWNQEDSKNNNHVNNRQFQNRGQKRYHNSRNQNYRPSNFQSKRSRDHHNNSKDYRNKQTNFNEIKHPIGFKKSYYCELCDRSFSSENLLKQHISEHTTCPDPNCNYQAHYMMVDQHYSNVHTINSKNQALKSELEKCWKLETEEDILEWRKKRRAKYPKLENTVKASEDRELNLKRKREYKVMREEKQVVADGERQIRMLEKKQKRELENELRESQMPYKINLPKSPLRDELEPEQLEPEKPQNIDILQEKKNSKSPKNSQNMPNNISYLRDADEACRGLWPPNYRTLSNLQNKNQAPTALNTKNSLLQKLLSPEIARERNLILQCIEHTVKNDFYRETHKTLSPKTNILKRSNSINSSNISESEDDEVGQSSQSQDYKQKSENSTEGSSSSESSAADSEEEVSSSEKTPTSDGSSNRFDREISEDFEEADGPDDEKLLSILSSFLG